ncbi:MAG TPA: hypothetical protein VGL53_12165 [Bryobacteraceae bacterium]|jgi:hypothetical protein
MKKLSLFTPLGLLCLCQGVGAIDIPHIGYARDPQGMVRPVDGVSGNFRIGDPVAADPSLAFEWNGVFGIRKIAASIEWWDASATRLVTFDAPSGGAVIGYDRSNFQTAWIYSATAHTLFQVTPQSGMVPFSLRLSMDESVVAIAGSGKSVDIALRRGGSILLATFDTASGSRTAETALNIPASSHLLLLQDGSILGLSGSTVWLDRADGTRWSANAGPGLGELTWMGREWIQLSGPSRQSAIRIRTGSDPTLYTLPAQQAVIE